MLFYVGHFGREKDLDEVVVEEGARFGEQVGSARNAVFQCLLEAAGNFRFGGDGIELCSLVQQITGSEANSQREGQYKGSHGFRGEQGKFRASFEMQGKACRALNFAGPVLLFACRWNTLPYAPSVH